MASPAKEDLRGPVPPRTHIVCVRRPGPDLSRQSEVRDLDEVRAHAQQVLGLHVAVEVAVFVHEGEALQHLEHHVPDDALGEQLVSVVVSLLHHLIEILFHVLEHKVQRVVLPDNLTASTTLTICTRLSYRYITLEEGGSNLSK